MSRFCLDTSAYSHFKRGDSKVVELVDSADWLGMPFVVLGELWVGFIQGGRLEQNEVELNEFLANPVVELLAIDEEVAQIYAQILVALRKAATPIPTNDIWIAAVSVRYGATLLTYDAHFHAVTRLGSMVLH